MHERVLFLFLFSNCKRELIWKVTEAVQVSQLGCVGSEKKLQRRKKVPGSLGDRKSKATCLPGQGGSTAWSIGPHIKRLRV